MENKHKHLEMIQGVINRMAANSFSLKGWAVTLVAGIFALASKDTDKLYFLVAYVPIIVFWGLDSYYLLQERLYRALYGKVRKLDDDKIDYDMNANLPEYKSDKNSFWSCVISPTELWFYLPLALISAGIMIITHIS
mgnify:CR=1 FL=1